MERIWGSLKVSESALSGGKAEDWLRDNWCSDVSEGCVKRSGSRAQVKALALDQSAVALQTRMELEKENQKRKKPSNLVQVIGYAWG